MSDTPASDTPRFLSPGIFLPFMAVSIIWGGTWFVIRDQIGVVPATWSIAYRFGVASIGAFVLAAILRQPLKLTRATFGWAALLGLTQFTLNFNFVYAAEHHITSGLVAVLFALLIIPNSVFARLWIGIKLTPTFWLGSLIASAGVGLLIFREYSAVSLNPAQVITGTVLTGCAIMCASISNVVQASESVKRIPVVPQLAWAMLFGAIFDAVIAWVMHGPPVFESRPAYLGGILYLAIIGSVLTFPLYFKLIRDIGPGKAAYSGVITPIIAMIISTLFEGYHWSPLSIGGAVLSVIGLVIAMRARQ